MHRSNLPSKPKQENNRSGTCRNIRVFVILVLMIIPAGASWSQLTCISAASGPFSDPLTWSQCSGGVPSANDYAIIQGHTVTAAPIGPPTVVIRELHIESNGSLIIEDHGVIIYTELLRIENGSTLSGKDIIPRGVSVNIRPRAPGILEVENNGTIKGGNPSGNVDIHDGTGFDVPCSNGTVSFSKIMANQGEFLGGDGRGSVFLVSREIGLSNSSHVRGGSGMPAPNIDGWRIAGNVYIGGTIVSADSSSRIESGSIDPLPPPGMYAAGAVSIISHNCPGIVAALNVTVGVHVFSGNPIPAVGGWPCLVLNSPTVGSIAGAIGTTGSGCVFWDPPLLELLAGGLIRGEHISLVGADFDASALVSTGLEASDTIEVILTPGGTIDLRNLTPGTNYFEAGNKISLCASNILLDPGTNLSDLMDPPPQLCTPREVAHLTLNQGREEILNAGGLLPLAFEVINTGTMDGNVNISLVDSEGWLVGGPVNTTQFLTSGDRFAILAEISPPSEATGETVLQLTGELAGTVRVEKSVVKIFDKNVDGEIFGDGFESGDTSRWAN